MWAWQQHCFLFRFRYMYVASFQGLCPWWVRGSYHEILSGQSHYCETSDLFLPLLGCAVLIQKHLKSSLCFSLPHLRPQWGSASHWVSYSRDEFQVAPIPRKQPKHGQTHVLTMNASRPCWTLSCPQAKKSAVTRAGLYPVRSQRPHLTALWESQRKARPQSSPSLVHPALYKTGSSMLANIWGSGCKRFSEMPP